MNKPDDVVQPPVGAGDVVPCQRIVELVTCHMEGVLDPAAAAAVGCQAFLGQMRATVAALRQVPGESLSGEAKVGLMTAFRDYRAT